jgi:hypothetical protein
MSKTSSRQKHKALSRKITKNQKRIEDVVQVVQLLTSKPEAPSSNPSANKTKKVTIFKHTKR